MLQLGLIMIAMAIHSLYIGKLVSGLMCLSGGLFFISGRKSDLNMKVTWKSLVTPVEDGEDTGPFEAVTRFASYAIFAVAAFVAVQGWLDGFLHDTW